MPTPTLKTLARFRSSFSSSIGRTTLRSANVHTTRPLYIKDAMKDRTKMDTESNEYSKSGSDDAAAHKETAFKPDSGSSHEAMGSQEKKQGDSLNVSPGNQDISHPVDPKAGGAEKSAKESAGEQKSSGGGSPSKGKKIS